MRYKKEFVRSSYGGGDWVLEVNIVAGNGVVIATCSTEATAEKIIRGLNLLAEEEKRRASFRL